MDHIKAFLNAIGVFLIDVYDFFANLFDWDKVLEARDVVKTVFRGFHDTAEEAVSDTIPTLIEDFVDMLKEVKAAALGVAEESPWFVHASAGRSERAGGDQATMRASVRSGKSTYLSKNPKTHNAQEVPVTGAMRQLSGGTLGDGSAAHHSDMHKDLQKLFGHITHLFTQPGGLHSVTGKQLIGILNDILDIALYLAEEFLLAITDMATAVLTSIRDILEYEIEIGFISELYKTISGNPLTILDLLSLLMGLPLHVVATIISVPLVPREVDNALSANPVFPPTDLRKDAVGTPSQTTINALEIMYLVGTELAGLIGAISAASTGATNAKQGMLVQREDYDDNDGLPPLRGIHTPKFGSVFFHTCVV